MKQCLRQRKTKVGLIIGIHLSLVLQNICVYFLFILKCSRLHCYIVLFLTIWQSGNNGKTCTIKVNKMDTSCIFSVKNETSTSAFIMEFPFMVQRYVFDKSFCQLS